MSPDCANSPPKHTPHIPKPYAHKPGPKAGKSTSKHTPRTSSFSNAPSSQQNLTLHDWLHVVNWFNENQPISQEVAVQHFAMKPWFLTRHLFPTIWARRGGSKIRWSLHQHRHHCCPKESMLSQDLWLWVEHMESKHETVLQPMLIEKWARFGDMLNVPEPQRLWSGG